MLFLLECLYILVASKYQARLHFVNVFDNSSTICIFTNFKTQYRVNFDIALLLPTY